MGLGRRERKMEAAVCVTRFRPVALGSDERAKGRAYLSPYARALFLLLCRRLESPGFLWAVVTKKINHFPHLFVTEGSFPGRHS